MMKLINLPKPSPSAKVSKEILDTFTEEVNKIQEEITNHFELWKNEPTNLRALKTVQRGFHTLRGNGYLVGAVVIGELGWQIENLFNQIMEHSIERNELLFSLVERAQKILPQLVEQFQKNQPASYEAILLLSQISHFTKTKGQELGEFESPKDLFMQHLTHLKAILDSYEQELPFRFNPEIIKILHTLDEYVQNIEIKSLSEIIMLLKNYSHVLSEKRTFFTKDKLLLFYKAIGFIERLLGDRSLDQEEQQALLDSTKVALSVEEHFSPEHATFFDKAKKVLEELQFFVNQWPVISQATGTFNTLHEKWQILKNYAHQERITEIEELCHHLALMSSLPEGEIPSHQELKNITQMGIDELVINLEALRSGKNINISQTLIDRIHQYPPQLILDKHAIYNEIYKEDTVHQHELDEVVRIKITLIQKFTELTERLTYYRFHMEHQQAVVKNNLVNMEHAIIHLRDQSQHLKIETQLLSYYRWISKVNAEELEPLKLHHFPLIQELSSHFIDNVNALVNLQDALKKLTEQTDILLVQQTRMSAELQDIMLAIHKVPFWNILPALQKIIRLLTKEFHSQIDFVVHGTHMKFERNLLHILLTLFEYLLRNLVGYDTEFFEKKKPSLCRILVDINQEEDEFIIEVNNKNLHVHIDHLRKSVDKMDVVRPHLDDHALIQFLLEPALNRRKGSMGLDGIKDYVQFFGGTLHIHFQPEQGTTFEIRLPKHTPLHHTRASINEEYIEIETSLMDKLTDLTETLSASRIDMERQQRHVKDKLDQMEHITHQLRHQLHRLKMEIQAQFSPFNRPESEPQELSHFPLIQQLSSHLLEGINRLVNGYTFLKILLNQVGKLLVHQTHMSTELQIVILQAHKVPFSKITVRLQKTVNFAAQKLNKKINFTIHGDQIEFERTILSHLIRPIEMMLKNAIVYGIEETEVRQKRGKPLTAKLLLDITQTTSEVMIKLSDDGDELDVATLRKKAEELELINPHTVISDQAMMQLVLNPSLKIERCREMDKINHDIECLGGLLFVHSTLNEGVTFEIQFRQAFSYLTSFA